MNNSPIQTGRKQSTYYIGVIMSKHFWEGIGTGMSMVLSKWIVTPIHRL